MGFCGHLKNIVAFLLVLVAIWVYSVLSGGPYLSPLCTLFKTHCPIVEIEGEVDPKYERVRELLAEQIQIGNEKSACIVAYVKGKKVVDICGGRGDDQQGYRHSLQHIYSCSKFVSQAVVATLVDKGLLQFDEKIAKYWPEFAQGGKENVTLSDLLRHAAGVAWTDDPIYLDDLEDLDSLASKLAKQKHNFNGERKLSYHAMTQGAYLNEIVRRVDPQHRTIGQIVRDEFNAKLGTEIYIGFDNKTAQGREELARVWPRLTTFYQYPTASMIVKVMPTVLWGMLSDAPISRIMKAMMDPNSVQYKTYIHGFKPYKRGQNSTAFLGEDISHFLVEMPAGNGIANAKSLARLAAVYAGKGTFDGVTLFSPQTYELANTNDLPAEEDVALLLQSSRTKGGYGVFDEEIGGARGWGGNGGSNVFFDPKREIGFGYVMNAAETGMLHIQRGGMYLRNIQKIVDEGVGHA